MNLPTSSITPIQPIAIAPRLAKTPKSSPRFSLKVQTTMGGEALEVADPRATRAMVALMDMNAQHGGAASHYGGPAAFAELMSATHALMFHVARKNQCEWYDAFNFVNDAGHCENGLYALKANYGFADLNIDALKKFRSIESKLTGHGEAHLFPEGVLVSNGPLGSGLPQAQGLAMGDALSAKKRITVCAISDGGAMEGEAKEAFAAIPGLARKGKLAPFIMIISDNRTKLSGRIETDAFSMEPTFQALDKLGWRVMRLEDGHQLQACVATIEDAIAQVTLDPTVPVAIHARTIKGKGNKKSEQSNTGAHGFPLKKADELPAFLTEIYEGTDVPREFITWADELRAWEASREKASEDKKAAAKLAAASGVGAPANAFSKFKMQPSEKIQLGVAAALIGARKKGFPVVSVSADLQGSTGVADFQKAYPEAALDVGVAEANMVSAAVGLSLAGYIPIVDTFAQFGVTKGALPLTMGSLSQGPVIGIFSHTGFQDAADGASHQALSFFAQVGAIPHVEIYSLSSSNEAEALIGEAVESFANDRKAGRVPPSRIFFLGRENFPRRWLNEGEAYRLGRNQVVIDTTAGKTKSVVFAVSGSLVGEAVKAAEELDAKGVGSIVVHASSVNKPDLSTIVAALKKSEGRLVTAEEHRLTAGMGAMLVHALVLSKVNCRVQSLAVGDHFGQSAYSALELYHRHGLDAATMVRAALDS